MKAAGVSGVAVLVEVQAAASVVVQLQEVIQNLKPHIVEVLQRRVIQHQELQHQVAAVTAAAVQRVQLHHVPSATARQKQTATTSAKRTNTTSTRNNTTSRTQQRQTTAQNRKQGRQLKAENRTLKRKVTTANRQTAQARRQTRSTITVNNFGGYYPVTGYSLYSMHASMAFNNLLFGIYFHDYYNHSIRHSYLWHYHHRDYDRSHWSKEKQEEYEFYKEYYESQGVEPNPNYVDPGTNPDENYVASYVEENPDKFYGENAQVVTVDELPDEAAIKQELLATTVTPSVTTNTQRAPPEPRTVIIEKKTSGATWFVLVFCSLLIVGGIMLILYNKGYF